MSVSENTIEAYIQLADEIDKACPESIQSSPKPLLVKAADLPCLTPSLLQQLVQQAMESSLRSPRRGWLILAAADAAADHQDDDFLRAQAAWYLGQAANEYGRPKLAKAALERARERFTELDEPGWLAATTWQKYVLAWAVGDLDEAVEQLESAVQTLQTFPQPLVDFAPHCQLSLAYAKLLKGDLDTLPALVEQCMAYFKATDDRLHQARTLFVHSGYLRRTAPFNQAVAVSEKGMALAQSVKSMADIGRFHCQIGFNNWFGKGDYQAAIQSFESGIELFRSLDIPGWLAQCQDGLAQIYIMLGRFSEVDKLVNSALTIFKEEDAFGQQPPTLFTAAWLEKMKGNYQKSVDYYYQAEAGYLAVGNIKMIPVLMTGLGDTYLQLGRFQQALQCFEQAYEQLEASENNFRLAECGLRLARFWTQLNDPNQAKGYLKQVKEHALKADYVSALLAYYLRSAELDNHQGNSADALQSLEEALRLAHEQENHNVELLCRRQLAKAYAGQARLEEAIDQLSVAEVGIKEMGLQYEQAACLLIWGDIYRQLGRRGDAKAAWEEAERFSRMILPELNWQAAAALGKQAEENHQKEDALAHYRQMLGSLALLRQGFWQPELAGSYSTRPSVALNQAVLLSAKNGRSEEALTFIEETKAQTTARRLQAQAFFQEFDLTPPSVQKMKAEIQLLQDRLQTGKNNRPIMYRSIENGEIVGLLREKTAAYTTLVNRLQRQQVDSNRIPFNNGFDVEMFREQADKHIGDNWIALDYYQVGAQLVCYLLTSKTGIAFPIDLPSDLGAAMNRLSWLNSANGKPPVRVLKDAGAVLLPTAVHDHLRENMTLIIAPHRELHHIPWAGLHLNGTQYRPLIDMVRPVIIPSLQTLSLLWQRLARRSRFSNGFLLAVSDFQNRHATLPAVEDEAERMLDFIGQNGRHLLNEKATAAALQSKLVSDSAQFDFWHIASHAFHNGQSGHLSGLALYDRDFLLDEFWQLAPLPNLVAFSACGSSKSHLFEGDEHIGLTTTCLTAGANHVIGSIWNVQDRGMSGIMADFYTALQLQQPQDETAVSVSQALAQTQRQAWKDDKRWQQWAGFRCTGRP